MSLARVAIWTSQLGFGRPDEVASAVRDLEAAGFAGIWVPESTWHDPFVVAATVLAATERLTVASGVARLHGRAAQTMANAWRGLSAWYPDRFLLGLGVSHQPAVEGLLHTPYRSPLEAMGGYLAQLDAAPFQGVGAGRGRRVLAALGPRMLGLAADRADGAHPYLTPVAHTRFAREVLGAGPLLVPEVKVLFEPDRTSARAAARRAIGRSLTLPNYARNLGRFGFDPEEVSAAADPVIDALVAWGTDDDVASRVAAHLEAGADQVAVQVLGPRDEMPVAGWHRLAGVLR
jgi:probable F420-dependent oxidoreductase